MTAKHLLAGLAPLALVTACTVGPDYHAPEMAVPAAYQGPAAETPPPDAEVDPATIDWSTDEAAKYRFRQDPGKINAMASVKINFPSPDGVYMHDTPEQSLFSQLMRFDSSGCVRVQNVHDLVLWLLRDNGGWTRQRLDQTIKSGISTPVERLR